MNKKGFKKLEDLQLYTPFCGVIERGRLGFGGMDDEYHQPEYGVQMKKGNYTDSWYSKYDVREIVESLEKKINDLKSEMMDMNEEYGDMTAYNPEYLNDRKNGGE